MNWSKNSASSPNVVVQFWASVSSALGVLPQALNNKVPARPANINRMSYSRFTFSEVSGFCAMKQVPRDLVCRAVRR